MKSFRDETDAKRRRPLHGKLARCVGLVASAVLMGVASCARTNATPAPLLIRVVVVTTFEVGNDSGDEAGEFQNWVEHYPLSELLPFPQGYHSLRYNANDHVLGIVTGVGKSRAAASIMALGLDPRFDLSKAYWILAGIGASIPIEPRSARRSGPVLSSTAIWRMRSTRGRFRPTGRAASCPTTVRRLWSNRRRRPCQ